jgi:hypothetical protein
MEMNCSNINVLVVYDNFRSGCRAMALLKRLPGRGGVPGELNHVMLRFELLGEAGVFDLAVSQALTADLLVIATSEEQALPRNVREWLVQRLLWKEDAPRALVATFDYNPAQAPGHWRVSAELEKLAGYGNVQFFSNEGDLAREVNFGRVKGADWVLDSSLFRPPASGQN